MIKSFTNNKGIKYLFVGVLKEAVNFEVLDKPDLQIALLSYIPNTISNVTFNTPVITEILEDGDYKIIGLSKDLTEEQWKEVLCREDEDPYSHAYAFKCLIESLGFKENDNVLILKVKE